MSSLARRARAYKWIHASVLFSSFILILLLVLKSNRESALSLTAKLSKRHVPTYTVVVAKFNEDINWVNNLLLPREEIIVYDKGDANHSSVNANYLRRPLENIGRETMTFILHIIVNYFTLPDYTVLVQGNPFKHMERVNSANFGNYLAQHINSWPSTSQPLFTSLLEESPAQYPGLQFDNHFELHFSRTAPKLRRFVAGCQYILTRHTIQEKTVEFYLKIYEGLRRGSHVSLYAAHFEEKRFDPGEITPWDFERLASYLWLPREDRSTEGDE